MGEAISESGLVTQVLAALAALMSLVSVFVCSRIKAAVAELKAEILQLLLGFVSKADCDQRMKAGLHAQRD